MMRARPRSWMPRRTADAACSAAATPSKLLSSNTLTIIRCSPLCLPPCVKTSNSSGGALARQFLYQRVISPIPCPLSALTLAPSVILAPSRATFRKLYLVDSRTYLQEPALRRPGGIPSCPTATGLCSPRPLSSRSPLFSSRRSAPLRRPPPPRQVPANQRLPHRRTAGCI